MCCGKIIRLHNRTFNGMTFVLFWQQFEISSETNLLPTLSFQWSEFLPLPFFCLPQRILHRILSMLDCSRSVARISSISSLILCQSYISYSLQFHRLLYSLRMPKDTSAVLIIEASAAHNGTWNDLRLQSYF